MGLDAVTKVRGTQVNGPFRADSRIHRKLTGMMGAAGRSFRLFKAAATLVAALVASSIPVIPAAHAQGTVVGTFGDWTMECDIPPGAQFEQCALVQSVRAADRDNVGLYVIVLKTADQQAQLLRVVAPLGVLLPGELGLNIDGEAFGRAPFVRCVQEGCVAEVLLEEPILAAFRTGTTATFIIFLTPEEGIGIPISLLGFAEGFDALP
jgi:invasion protein IalB